MLCTRQVQISIYQMLSYSQRFIAFFYIKLFGSKQAGLIPNLLVIFTLEFFDAP